MRITVPLHVKVVTIHLTGTSLHLLPPSAPLLLAPACVPFLARPALNLLNNTNGYWLTYRHITTSSI